MNGIRMTPSGSSIGQNFNRPQNLKLAKKCYFSHFGHFNTFEIRNSTKLFIGVDGSNLQKIKQQSGCRITVADNGRIWVEGSDKGISEVRNISAYFSKSDTPYPNLKSIKNFNEKMEEL